MPRDQLPAPLAVVLACLFIAVVAARCAPVAKAESDDALDLARTVVHEAGWNAPDDTAAIYAVWRSGAAREGMSVASFARAYSPRLHSGRVTRVWAAGLRADGREPAGWPEGLAWSAYRARWREALALARAVVAGERADRCVEPPTDWGSPADARRAIRLGLRLRPVDCGDTRNVFFVRGRR